MKKTTLLSTAIFMLTSLSYSQYFPISKHDWKTDNLKGQVKQYSICSYDASDYFGEIQKTNLNIKTTYKYDIKGNLIEENDFKTNGSLNSMTSFTYDEKDNILEGAIYNSNGQLSSKGTYKYDDNGNQIEHKIYNSVGSLIFKLIYLYDDKGNIIEYKLYNDDGRLALKETYKYDVKGNQIEKANYKDNLNLLSKETCKFDEKDNQIEQNCINANGSLSHTKTCKYDDKGHQIEVLLYSSDGQSSKEIYLFDHLGNTIEYGIYGLDGHLLKSIKYKYNDDGNLIEENWYNADGNYDRKKTYKYDKNGNWIEQIEFTSEILIPQYFIERKFEYYPENPNINTVSNHNNSSLTDVKNLRTDSFAASVQIKANFPGGETAFQGYLEGEFQYPPRCYEKGINVSVLLRFAVDEAGRISQVEAIEETKDCPEGTTEAIRVLKKSPRWIPGQNNGTFVKSWRVLPVKLSLE